MVLTGTLHTHSSPRSQNQGALILIANRVASISELLRNLIINSSLDKFKDSLLYLKPQFLQHAASVFTPISAFSWKNGFRIQGETRQQ